MRKFWGYYKNQFYSVGCNGNTVYIYDEKGKELAKFKDIPYAYTAIFKPNSNIIAVKSTAGFLAFYDLDNLSLLKKMKVSSIGSQDDGFAFSNDSKYFYNIERPCTSIRTQLGIYDGETFKKICTLFVDEKKMFLRYLEIHQDTVYVMGFMRGKTGVFEHGFVGIFNEATQSIDRRYEIDTELYNYLRDYKHWEMQGFTEKSAFKSLEIITPISIKEVHDKAQLSQS